MKKFLTFIFMLILVFSCGNKNETKSNEEFKEKIHIVLDWTPNTNHTGLFVAQEKGFFKDLGLDVTIDQAPEGSTTALIASGKSQFGISFQDALANYFSSDEKVPVVAVAALLQHNTSGLVSLKEKNITSFKDLEGKTYATWEDPIEQAMLKYLMSKEDADFSKVNVIPYSWDVIRALKTETDSTWIFYAWDGISLEYNNIPFNFMEAKVVPELDYYTPVLIANSDFAEKNPEVTKKVLSAIKKGYLYSIDHVDEAVDILHKQAPELERDFLVKSQTWINNQYVDKDVPWGKFDSNRWNNFYNWLFNNGIIKKSIDKDYGFTNQYLED